MRYKKQLALTISLLAILFIETIITALYNKEFFSSFYDTLEPALTFIFPALIILAISSFVYFFKEGNQFFNKSFRILTYILLAAFIYALLSNFQLVYDLMRNEGKSGIALSSYYALKQNIFNLLFIGLTIFALYAQKSVIGKPPIKQAV